VINNIQKLIDLEPDIIFVFGSNLAGIHGAGAAKFAYAFKGAVKYVGYGLRDKSFALPTKDEKIKTLPLNRINYYVNQFKTFCIEHPELPFQVTRIGCGLAGYKDQQIAPMFKNFPDNCFFPLEWKEYNFNNYWTE